MVTFLVEAHGDRRREDGEEQGQDRQGLQAFAGLHLPPREARSALAAARAAAARERRTSTREARGAVLFVVCIVRSVWIRPMGPTR